MKKSPDNAVTLPPSQETVAAMLADSYTRNQAFRVAFDRDPKAAIAEYYKQELPADMEIIIHRNEDKRWHVALPSLKRMQATQLADEDMEEIAGGYDSDWSSWRSSYSGFSQRHRTYDY